MFMLRIETDGIATDKKNIGLPTAFRAVFLKNNFLRMTFKVLPEY